MKLNELLLVTALLLALPLLGGCPGTMTVDAVDPADDDDSQPADDDDDLTPGDDDDDRAAPADADAPPPRDDDDATPPGDDDDDDTDPGPGPIAECAKFVSPEGNFPKGSAHYIGDVLAHRPNPGDNRIWEGCEVRRYFDSSNQYRCQVYWSMIGPRVEWTDPCSIYTVEATYVPEYSDCSPAELGNEDFLLNDFHWIYGTEYHWPQPELSLWVTGGNNPEPEVPGGPPGGECGFNGPQGQDWIRVDQDIEYLNWDGGDSWEFLAFQYSTDFQPLP